MAAAPVRQRSAAAGPRSQLPPCYYEGYLEKRGPREKVGPTGVAAMLSRLHVVASGCQGAGAYAGQPPDLSFPELSTSSLCSHGRGESGPWCCRRSAGCRRSHVLMSALGKKPGGDESSHAWAHQISTGETAAVKTLSF